MQTGEIRKKTKSWKWQITRDAINKASIKTEIRHYVYD